MPEINPYQAPDSTYNKGNIDSEKAKKVATGEKLITIAIFIYIFLIIATILLFHYGVIEIIIYTANIIVRFFAAVFSIIGVIKLTSVLHDSIIIITGFGIIYLPPTVNILILLLFSVIATRKLREIEHKSLFSTFE